MTKTCAECDAVIEWECIGGLRVFTVRAGVETFSTRCGCGAVMRHADGRRFVEPVEHFRAGEVLKVRRALR